MSKYNYYYIGAALPDENDWENAVSDIDGEIVETVERKNTTVGLIVKEREVNIS